MGDPRKTPKLEPQFELVFKMLKQALEQLKKIGMVPTMKPAEEDQLLKQLTNDLLGLKQKNGKQFDSIMNNASNKKFAIFAYFRPEFKDLKQGGQILDAISSPNPSMGLFAKFRLTMNKCLNNMKKENPEAEKLLEKMLDILILMAKMREEKQTSTQALTDNPLLKQLIDPMVAFFQQYFGQDIRQTGASQTTTQSPIQSTANINTAGLDQGPGESPAEEAVKGDSKTPINTPEKEQAAEQAPSSSIKPPWMKTGGGPQAPGGAGGH